MALIELPSVEDVAAELVEPSFLHTAPNRDETVIITGATYWRGSVTLSLTDDEHFPTRGGPSVQAGDLLRIPLTKAPPAADAGVGPVVSSDVPGIWTLSSDLPSALRRPFDTYFRAGEDGPLVRLEEVRSGSVIRVAPAILGVGVLYHVTAIFARVTEAPPHYRNAHFAGPWVYDWREA